MRAAPIPVNPSPEIANSVRSVVFGMNGGRSPSEIEIFLNNYVFRHDRNGNEIPLFTPNSVRLPILTHRERSRSADAAILHRGAISTTFRLVSPSTAVDGVSRDVSIPGAAQGNVRMRGDPSGSSKFVNPQET